MSDTSESPVHVVTPPASSPPQEPIGLQNAHLLKGLLYPLHPNDFMTHDFRRNAVHIQASSNKKSRETTNGKKQSSCNNRFQPIIEEGMYALETWELVKETSSDSVFVWLAAANTHNKNNENRSKQKKKTGDHQSNGNKQSPILVQSIELPDADTALALHESSGGHALYCRAPPQVEQILVSKLLRDTGLGCGQYDPAGESMTSLARGEVEMFITSKAGGTTDWHYDFQENFTLQLSGVKRWTLQRGTVKHPLRACTPHYKAQEVVENQLKAARLSAPEFVFDQPKTATGAAATSTAATEGFNAEGPTETVTLYPGDFFYFPAGMWHKIEVLEPGVSINVSLMATNFANVACQALQHYLLQKDEWRQVLVHNPEAAAVSTNNKANFNNSLNALEHLKGLLKKLPRIIEEFEQNCGGANSILPPVLLRPPNFHGLEEQSEEDDDNEAEDDDEENDDDGEDRKPPAKKARHQDGVEETIMSEVPDGDSDEGSPHNEKEWDNVVVEDEDEEGGIIDACDFQCPPGYVLTEVEITRQDHKKIVRNPLASLIRMDDVNRYYATLAGKEEENDKDEHLFVLNVNYAGVESHESSVRVVLRDDPTSRYLNTLYGSTEKTVLDKMVKDCPHVVGCLLYYGYYALVPGKG